MVCIKKDVLLLADVSRTFRKESANSFKLEPFHHILIPGYSSDAIKKFTGVTYKLTSDIENYQVIASMTTGGIFMTSNGYAKANNKFKKLYNLTKPAS